MRGGGSSQSALALGELCYGILLRDGMDALSAVRNQSPTPALERLVEANTLLSGLGFESSGLAAAHAIHNGLTAVPETHSYFHGEKVAYGVLVQLILEKKPQSLLEEVLDFSTRVGLPTTLAAREAVQAPERHEREHRREASVGAHNLVHLDGRTGPRLLLWKCGSRAQEGPGLGSDLPNVIMVARLTNKQKAGDLLLNAFAGVAKKVPARLEPILAPGAIASIERNKRKWLN